MVKVLNNEQPTSLEQLREDAATLENTLAKLSLWQAMDEAKPVVVEGETVLAEYHWPNAAATTFFKARRLANNNFVIATPLSEKDLTIKLGNREIEVKGRDRLRGRKFAELWLTPAELQLEDRFTGRMRGL